MHFVQRCLRSVAHAACIVTAAQFLCAASFATETRWDDDKASALIEFADQAARHGLDPSFYDTQSLAASMERGDRLAVELAASELFSRLARDLEFGVTPEGERRRWRIHGPVADDAVISAAMERALETGRIAESLDALAPQHSEYQALSAALSKAQDSDLERLFARNMERWRWMPRDLGADYVLVNVPSYEAIVVRQGKEIARHRVIVGARKTPTQQFSASIAGVSFNPTWYVPQSIVAESVGALIENKPEEAERQGYYKADDGGVRQKPGPGNALGRMKLAMPNPYSVFIHDTPFRKNFELEKRALSHGCIRVDDALGFATVILGDGWNREIVDELAATGSTVAIDLATPIPVYIGYFTAMTNAAGDVVAYDDIYRLDTTILTGKAREAELAASDALGECRADASG